MITGFDELIFCYHRCSRCENKAVSLDRLALTILVSRQRGLSVYFARYGEIESNVTAWSCYMGLMSHHEQGEETLTDHPRVSDGGT
jgi:hypothetical protein